MIPLIVTVCLAVCISVLCSTTLSEPYENKNIWHFSRIPAYDTDNEDITDMREPARKQRAEVLRAAEDNSGNAS